jgi:hypothetical protein
VVCNKEETIACISYFPFISVFHRLANEIIGQAEIITITAKVKARKIAGSFALRRTTKLAFSFQFTLVVCRTALAEGKM